MKQDSTWGQASTLADLFLKSLRSESGQTEWKATGTNFLHYLWRLSFLVGGAYVLDRYAGHWFTWLAPGDAFPLALIAGSLAMLAFFGASYLNTQAQIRVAASALLQPLLHTRAKFQRLADRGQDLFPLLDVLPTREGWDVAVKFLEGNARGRRAPWPTLKSAAMVADEMGKTSEAQHLVRTMLQAELGRAMAMIPMYTALQLALAAAIAAAVPALHTSAMSFVLLLNLFWLGWQTLVVFTQRT